MLAPIAELPVPRSEEPHEYARWLRSLPAHQRDGIAAVCRAHRTTYQAVCGGIGPLHIPLPPEAAGPMPGPGINEWTDRHLVSLFSSRQEWSQALTIRQRRYVASECGEDYETSDLCGVNTPLVVAFENQPVTFKRGGTFAFQPGSPVGSDWPSATTPWIAFDRNHDGRIDHGGELFGSDTVLPDGIMASNGFVALAALDSNQDGRIDASDPAFASLLLWTDRDDDQRSAPDELTQISIAIVSISLANHIDARCDARENCEGERSVMTWRDSEGELHDGSIVDVYLPRR